MTSTTSRRITQRTRGHGHGPITRLMSPSDLGQIVKPFVFLDLFDADKRTVQAMADMPLHPHSGIATVTVPVEGSFRYEDPATGASGTLGRLAVSSGAVSGCGVEVLSTAGVGLCVSPSGLNMKSFTR